VTVDLRGAMRSFDTGVLDPRLVSVCLRHHSAFLADLLKTKVWALSILDVGAMDIAREFAKSRDARTTALRTGTQQHARPARRRRGAARGRLNRRGTSTSNGPSVATGQPSLITNRCYKEYM
jgi:hypothetical protein